MQNTPTLADIEACGFFDLPKLGAYSIRIRRALNSRGRCYAEPPEGARALLDAAYQKAVELNAPRWWLRDHGFRDRLPPETCVRCGVELPTGHRKNLCRSCR